MISTKNIITDIKQVPSSWIFEHYLKLEEQLVGQEVFMIGPFNQMEKIPSFSIFSSKEGHYSYKCFSTGKGGSSINFVKELFRLKTTSEAIVTIIRDYQAFLDKGGKREDVEYHVFDKYKVTGFELRTWNTNDKRFWGKFKIGSKMLEWLNVAPLESFQMSKMENGKEKTITIRRDCLYGYFTKQGQLYRIYQPGQGVKFIKVMTHVMGLDQLQYKVPNLLITKSLKDIAAFYELRIPGWEVIAAESENSILPEEFIAIKKTQYKRIVTLMDNDKAGKEAMLEYKSRYGLEGIELDLSKDISDSVEDFGQEKVRETFLTKI